MEITTEYIIRFEYITRLKTNATLKANQQMKSNIDQLDLDYSFLPLLFF